MSIKPSDVRFDERGLVPAIVQDARTREVLTLAYMNEESLRRTLAEGETWFWSRSRNELWHKGATSGNTQRVVEVRTDCDSDALVVLVEPRGPACHTGARSCFGSGAGDTEASIGVVLEEVFRVVSERRREMPEGSYTTYLFEKGLNKILKKVGEESAETIIAAKDGDDEALKAETADLLYHLVVMLVERGLTLEDVGRELARRRKGSE
ncbi:MAG TPA: bifunctional phosphoribosyl-AMP cyclohydrolase/phosphoribosyl-ATP diphosphatase HisIE [Pyrinomonadaceae bacterium]|jgi:phosphoribosyl-ATP pyrophosphohydrolase/phosphoribosyl-AMP cyclohydrolase|nr:bifunctional phosphoribosyl-AMP cyclohydrolase/phosphoribosyl-ATP diphosphatase HisIE [Pyrinomonadaceae bacterium]